MLTTEVNGLIQQREDIQALMKREQEIDEKRKRQLTTEYNNNKSEYDREIERLEAEKRRLTAEIESLEKTVQDTSDVEKKLEEVEGRIRKDEDAYIIWRMLEASEKLPLNRYEALNTSLKLIFGFHNYLDKLPDKPDRLLNFMGTLEAVKKELVELVEDEGRRYPR